MSKNMGYDSDKEQMWSEEDFASPLHIAIGQKHPDIEAIRALLTQENVNEKNAHGQTPAFIAAADNKVEILAILQQFGADFNLRDNFESTALELACDKKASEAAKYLLDNGAYVDPPIKEEVEQLTGAILVEAPTIQDPEGNACFLQGKYTQRLQNTAQCQNSSRGK